MHASFPPFGRQAAPEHDYRAPEPKTAASAPVSDREADLRTIKHYLYHAGLLLEKLVAEEAEAKQFMQWQMVDGITTTYDSGPRELSADFTRDRDATGA